MLQLVQAEKLKHPYLRSGAGAGGGYTSRQAWQAACDLKKLRGRQMVERVGKRAPTEQLRPA